MEQIKVGSRTRDD